MIREASTIKRTPLLLSGLFVVAVATGVSCVAPKGQVKQAPREDGPADAVGILHRLLEPHGRWTRDADHGWVWTPDPTTAGPEFIPYTAGRFVLTDAGLMFVGTEPWAWITYHYGRWADDAAAGWYWVPGANWAPAWVGWRRGGGLVGWSPLPPRRHERVASAPSRWVFVAESDLSQGPLRARLLPRAQLTDAIKRTEPAEKVSEQGPVRWYRGPARTKLPTAMRDDPVIELSLPRAGRLAKVRLAGESAKTTDRGPLVIRQPRADDEGDDAPRPKAKAKRRRLTRSITGEVTPVMPPLGDDERGQRWR